MISVWASSNSGDITMQQKWRRDVHQQTKLLKVQCEAAMWWLQHNNAYNINALGSLPGFKNIAVSPTGADTFAHNNFYMTKNFKPVFNWSSFGPHSTSALCYLSVGGITNAEAKREDNDWKKPSLAPDNHLI